MSSPNRRTSFSILGLALAGALLVGMSTLWWPSAVHTSEAHTFRVEPFAKGLDVPWGMAFLPDGRLLVTEREGTLRVVATDGTVSDPIKGTPEVCACGQGGMMDVHLHPAFENNRWIYLSYADKKGRKGFTAVLRARLEGMALVEQEVIYQAPEDVYTRAGQHFGSRIVFDEDGYLYFTIGDRGQRNDAQRLDVPNGKVHRLHDDGRIPHDNPFVNVSGAVASIWSYGHRNPQGLDRHPATGMLWATEHGPRGGDELNHVRRGLNFGWPTITYGINYNGTSITDLREQEGLEQPAVHWTPSIAVCGIGFYTGEAFPSWQNNLFVTSLKFGELRRVVLDGSSVTHQEVLVDPGGRLRDVATGPDGYLYIAIEGRPGKIVRLVPEDV